MLVLGAGLQGSACAYDLLQSPGPSRVLVADLHPERLPPFLDRYRDDPRLELISLDATDDQAVLAAMGEADACMNALPYYFNERLARLAVRAGIHYCDLGGNTAIVFRQLELDGAARDRGISLIPDCGLAPGMINVLAGAAIDDLNTVETVRIYVGGLPQEPRPPLNYQIVYSLHGVLDYYTTPSWVVRGGEPIQVDALSEVEVVEFPSPVGTLEAFHTAGGLSVMPWTYQGRVRTMEYKTLRYPGHAHLMRSIRELGLLSLDPVRVGGDDVVPRDLFIATVEPRLRDPGAHDLVAVRVMADGYRDGEPLHIRYELLDFFDETLEISAMARATGFSLSITGQIQAGGLATRPGALPPDQGVPAELYIRELARRGVQIEKIEE